jgi:hypothetical protein
MPVEKDKVNAKMKIVRKQRKPKIWAQPILSVSGIRAPSISRRVPLRCLLSLHRRSYPLHLLCGQLVSTAVSHNFFGLISYHFTASFKGMGHTCEAQTWP